MSGAGKGVVVLGIYVTDLAFRSGRLPEIGETIIGAGFSVGPGGKGSNQAVAAARLGADVTFISKIGRDEFGSVALATWMREGIKARVEELAHLPTGAAFIHVNERSGENAIIVVPGAAGEIGIADVEAAADDIGKAAVFVTQLEQPAEAARRGLEIARAAGVTTILNPAPAEQIDEEIYPLCDFITPNESEASLLTGIRVIDVDDARKAAGWFIERGVGAAVITLGEAGALLHTRGGSLLVPAFWAGAVLDTAGAGDAFNGAFAAALASGLPPLDAVRFGCAAAGISVTRTGTAPSMPTLAEVDALIAAPRST